MSRRKYSEKTANRPNGGRHDHARDSAVPLSRSGAPIYRDRALSPDQPDGTRMRSYIQPDKNLNPYSERHPAGEKMSTPQPPKPELLSKTAGLPSITPGKYRLDPPRLPPKLPSTPQQMRPHHVSTGMYKNIKMATFRTSEPKQRIAHQDKRNSTASATSTADRPGLKRDSLSEIPRDAPAPIAKKTDASGPYRMSDGENHPDPIPLKRERTRSPGSSSSSESRLHKSSSVPSSATPSDRSREGPVRKESTTKEGGVASKKPTPPVQDKTPRTKASSGSTHEEEEDVKPTEVKKEEPIDDGYLEAEGVVPDSDSPSERRSHSDRHDMDEKDKEDLRFFQNVAEKRIQWGAMRVNKGGYPCGYQPSSRAGSNSITIQRKLSTMRRDLYLGKQLKKTPHLEPPPIPPPPISQAATSVSGAPSTTSAVQETAPTTPSAGSTTKTGNGASSRQPISGTSTIRNPPLKPPPLPWKRKMNPINSGCSSDPLAKMVASPGSSTPNRPPETKGGAPDSDDDIVFIEEVPPKKSRFNQQKRS